MRSLRNRLAVVFGLIVLGAIGTVYLSVTPRLQERLTEQKLDALQADAERTALGQRSIAEGLGTNIDGELLARRVGDAASRSSAEVLVLGRVRGNPPGLSLAEDSQANGGVRFDDVSGVALKAMETRRPQTDHGADRRRPAGARRPAACCAARRSSASRCSPTRWPTWRPTWP